MTYLKEVNNYKEIKNVPRNTAANSADINKITEVLTIKSA